MATTGVLNGLSGIPAAETPTAQPQSASDALSSVILSTTLSKEQPTASVHAAQVDHPYLLRKTTPVTINGYRYLLDFYIPIDRELSEYEANPAEHAALQKYAEEYTRMFAINLQNELGQSSQTLIKPGPGKAFNILLTEEEGYIVYPDGGKVQQSGFDPNGAIFTPESYEEKQDFIRINTPEAVEIGRIVNTANLEEFKSGIESPALQSLRAKPQSQTEAPRPVNLVNKGASCFLNAAFQQLVTNPALKDHLQPQYFNGEEHNPLYQELKRYISHQSERSSDQLRLSDELALNLGVSEFRQDDAHLVWTRFKQQFNWGAIPQESPLRTLFNGQPPIAPQNHPLKDLISKENFTHPDHFSIFVSRARMNQEPLHLPDAVKENIAAHLATQASEKDGYIAALAAAHPEIQNWNTLEEERYQNLRAILYENPRLRLQLDMVYYLNQLGEERSIDTIFADPISHHAAIEIMSRVMADNERAELNQYRQTAILKDSTPIQINDEPIEIVANGKTTRYDIQSFIVHRGASAHSGHYVTYTKMGNQYWLLDDLKAAPIQINRDQFIREAAEAISYALSKQNAPEGQIASNAEVETKQEGFLTVIHEVGALQGAGKEYTLVNRTNTALRSVNPELESMEDLKLAMNKARTRRAASKWFNKSAYSYSDGRRPFFVPDGTPDTEITQGEFEVLHVVMPDGELLSADEGRNLKNIQDSVIAALQEARTKKREQIAFSVASFIPQNAPESLSPEKVRRAIESAIAKFAKDNSDYVGNMRVKIIEPHSTSSQNREPPETAQAAQPVAEPIQSQPNQTVINFGPINIKIDRGGPDFTCDISSATPHTTLERSLNHAFEKITRALTRNRAVTAGFNFTNAISDPNDFNLGKVGEESTIENAWEIFRDKLSNFLKDYSNTNVTFELRVPASLDIRNDVDQLRNEYVERQSAVEAPVNEIPSTPEQPSKLKRLWNGVSNALSTVQDFIETNQLG